MLPIRREADILRPIGQRLRNNAFARRVGISVNTVGFQVEAMFGKLDATGRVETVAQGVGSQAIAL